MKSSISKLLHKVGNLEMINHIINTAKQLFADEICIVCAEDNITQIKQSIDSTVITTIQYERNGTAQATKVGLDALKHKENTILIMYGDVPLVSLATYQKLVETLNTSRASVVDLSFHTKDITNKYGRLIVEPKENALREIVEYKDASEDIRNITLCNAGIVAIKGGILDGLLSRVDNKNASGEYYLTDIIGIARKENQLVTYIVCDESEVQGVNSRKDLSDAEHIFQNRKREEFMANGVTLIDPNTVYFSYDTVIDNDVVIEPSVVIMPKVKISKNCTIKSFSYLENCTIPEGVVVTPYGNGEVYQKK